MKNQEPIWSISRLGARAFGRVVIPGLLLALVISSCVHLALAQGRGSARDPYERESTIDAEIAQQASLSAEEILRLLTKYPGLRLAVKRQLVRLAYEQGRLLDKTELTDGALYQLINQDATIRSLATREIERRGYLKVRLTEEEYEKELRKRQQRAREFGQPEPSEEEGLEQTPARRPRTQMATQGRQQEAEEGGEEPGQSRRGRFDQDKFEKEGELPLEPVRPEDLPALLRASSVDGTRAPGVPSSPYPDSSSLPEASDLARRLQSQSSRSEPRTQSSRGKAGEERLRPERVTYARRTEPPPIRHRPNPYAEVPSLYDIYMQVSPPQKLERFGMNVFQNGTSNLDDLPIDLPVGPEYVLGPGDGLRIELWGSVSERLQRVVDRGGQVALPEVGTVQVAGRTLGQVQQLLQEVLETQFRDVQADVSLGRLRSVRVYVVGDVEAPGPYDISSLSTPLNAIYAAGGPTERGSLRTVRHYRGKEVVQEVDLYDLILHGTRADMKHLEPGDTILVPPAGAGVTIEGMVRRPAIYQLRNETNLAEALELAGGVLPSGTMRRIEVERLEAHEKRTMLNLEPADTTNQETVRKALEDFKIQDGDKIRIASILPYSYQTVYLDGHVFQPGKYSYREGMKISDLIKSYSDLLPEPSQRHAEIIRLSPPDFRPQVVAFNLTDALAKNGGDLPLQPFDTVRVFGRYDFEDPPVVFVSGEVRTPGEHRTQGAMRVRDAVYLAGGVTPDAMLESAQIFRRTPGGKMKVLSVNLGKALAGDPAEDLPLETQDQVIVHRSMAKLDPPTVYAQGEVAKPGRYPLGQGMRASDLVQLAGGFKRGADTEVADLTRHIKDGQRLSSEQRKVEIAKALTGTPEADIELRDGDVLSVRQLSGWKDLGASVTVRGEVTSPSTYGITDGERLSSVLMRAGGFRAGAYPAGAVLERVQVRELAEAQRADLIRRMEAEEVTLKQLPEAKDANSPFPALIQVWQQQLEKLRNTPPSGRIVIRISSDIAKWRNTPADIEVRAGDVLTIPKRANFVLVQGNVYNPSAIAYAPGKSAGWYLSRAGGATEIGNQKAAFVVRADGSVIGKGSGGWWKGDAMGATLGPGDAVFVPERLPKVRSVWKTILESAQLGSTAGVILSVVTR